MCVEEREKYIRRGKRGEMERVDVVERKREGRRYRKRERGREMENEGERGREMEKTARGLYG